MLSAVQGIQSVSPVMRSNVKRLSQKMHCIEELYSHNSILQDSRDSWVTRRLYKRIVYKPALLSRTILLDLCRFTGRVVGRGGRGISTSKNRIERIKMSLRLRR